MVARYKRVAEALRNIRVGPGAAVFSPQVKALSLTFRFENYAGQMGARVFFRENLPRIQYHNPTLPITVTRDHAKDNACKMIVTMADGTTQEISMLRKESSRICSELLSVAKATPYTEAEEPAKTKQTVTA
ncbi:hypothetical protein SAICODRAFT_31762 [Saitoella complicata NRRL Y-17804]|uniref:Ribosomal protein/NADH dehydrogenase domain-containing protein n=1 Tax=Saitoella complicata (strain BCRC 22490 / CBS 7301 / JCM 7358 / NBRC 10748 / NRRL Y-17804) TaxID=698492 RepID=A0A0E9NDS3_SAICN|nr:uncharacterized protein SAICODRAFT_31762 [Saitoella complicata NRRL Y-17804]ODQ50727.1 hypothetical protein SAICODRAFT_31762 [Saitoella complicata NRRL Y-17804]GAO47989.1 hypothetical protein G7K_2179-t1 [Saitoella complicata NRRL Y-17804]